MKPEVLVFGVWSQSCGACSIITTSDSLAALGISEPFSVLQNNIQFILDGFGWKPLSSRHHYAAVLERIRSEVFPGECRIAITRQDSFGTVLTICQYATRRVAGVLLIAAAAGGVAVRLATASGQGRAQPESASSSNWRTMWGLSVATFRRST